MTGSWPRIHSLSSMLAPSHATSGVSRKHEDSVPVARHNTANAPIVTARGREGGGSLIIVFSEEKEAAALLVTSFSSRVSYASRSKTRKREKRGKKRKKSKLRDISMLITRTDNRTAAHIFTHSAMTVLYILRDVLLLRHALSRQFLFNLPHDSVLRAYSLRYARYIRNSLFVSALGAVQPSMGMHAIAG